MGQIPLEAVQPGMVLARDVIAETDRLLLGAGLALTESHLRILRLWGIGEVHVEGDGPGEAPAPMALDPARLAELETHLQRLFRRTDPDDVAIQALKELARARLVRRLTGGDTHGR
jgi:hypothetical protein